MYPQSMTGITEIGRKRNRVDTQLKKKKKKEDYTERKRLPEEKHESFCNFPLLSTSVTCIRCVVSVIRIAHLNLAVRLLVLLMLQKLFPIDFHSEAKSFSKWKLNKSQGQSLYSLAQDIIFPLGGPANVTAESKESLIDLEIRRLFIQSQVRLIWNSQRNSRYLHP